MTKRSARWPGESPEYRLARDNLLAAEHDLSTAIERVAAMRRALPLGGEPPVDFAFREGPRDIDSEGTETPVAMSDLFGKHPSLLLYSFMFDGARPPCPMCTSLIDGYDGAAADLEERVGFAVVAPAPLASLRDYGRGRGWRNVRLVADPDGEYSRNYGGINGDGELDSIMNVFTKRQGSIRHFYATEKRPSGPDEDDRHLDLLWVLWGALDLTPEGRDQQWRPSRPARR